MTASMYAPTSQRVDQSIRLRFHFDVRGVEQDLAWSPEQGFHGDPSILCRLDDATSAPEAIDAVNRALGRQVPFAVDL